MTMLCEAQKYNKCSCQHLALHFIEGKNLCGVHTRKYKGEKLPISNKKDKPLFEHEGKLELEKLEKTRKLFYKKGFLYIYLQKNNRKNGLCLPSLGLEGIVNIEVNGILFKNLENLIFSSFKLSDETIDAFKEKQKYITEYNRVNSKTNVEKYFIGNVEYTPENFRSLIFNLYKNRVVKSKDFERLVSLYNKKTNIIFAGEFKVNIDMNNYSSPIFAEGMLYHLLKEKQSLPS